MSINKYNTTAPAEFMTLGHEERIVPVFVKICMGKSAYHHINFISNVAIEFKDATDPSEFVKYKCGYSHYGYVYLTNKQLVWINKENDKLKSFSCRFSSIKMFEPSKPMFGANFVKLSCVSEPGECGFKGQVDLKLTFDDNEAFDFEKCFEMQKKPLSPNHFQQENEQRISRPPNYEDSSNHLGWEQPVVRKQAFIQMTCRCIGDTSICQ